jgi:co-chaperonin GroES (HSP10)
MKVGKKALIVVGDRVVIRPEKPDERTQAGLYLPQTAVGKNPVQTGRVVAVGPGIAVPTVEAVDDEPWKENLRSEHYIPMQAQIGDVALFLKEPSVDIKVEGEDYVVAPQSAILVLLRDEDSTE